MKRTAGILVVLIPLTIYMVSAAVLTYASYLSGHTELYEPVTVASIVIGLGAAGWAMFFDIVHPELWAETDMWRRLDDDQTPVSLLD